MEILLGGEGKKSFVSRFSAAYRIGAGWFFNNFGQQIPLIWRPLLNDFH
jgi:hypothetical protein